MIVPAVLKATVGVNSDGHAGSRVFDEDDFQVGADPYGRMLAVVYCDGANANAAMIASGHAATYARFCAASEFEREAWTGCP